MNTSTVGINLRKIRTLSKLSLKDVADDLRIQKGTLGNIERSDKSPSLDMLFKLANYFCISIDYLLGRTDDPQYEKYIQPAEEAFFNHPATSKNLIARYKQDKATHPIELAPSFLRDCEIIRDEHSQE